MWRFQKWVHAAHRSVALGSGVRNIVVPTGSGGSKVPPNAAGVVNSTDNINVPPLAPKGDGEATAMASAGASQLSSAEPIDYASRYSVKDHGPVRPTGLWKVGEVVNPELKTVEFRRIDEIESDIVEDLAGRGDALVPYDDEEKWKHRLMFVHKFKKTPKHLTWKELGQEIDCIDCVFELDAHRPEEIFTIKFYFVDKKHGTRDVIWQAKNDVSYSEGFTDLLAAIGSCLGRADVFRTIRFDDGQSVTRDICFRKKSRYTSDIQISFRPPVKYNLYDRKQETDEWETEMTKEGMSTWGYHPQLMDPEYQDFDDPEETYTISLSAHAFAFVFLRSIDRLLAKPLKEFYRPSQVLRTVKIAKEDNIGLSHAVKGWLGIDDQIYPHYTPIEAIQEYWLGKDAPFTIVAIVNKLREMTYLKSQNPEFQSWLAVRKRDSALAIRNVSVKLLGAGASTLFIPVGHNSTVNRLLPKSQQRRIESKVSLNSMLGMPDEVRSIGEFKKITGVDRITSGNESTIATMESIGQTTVAAANPKSREQPVRAPSNSSSPMESLVTDSQKPSPSKKLPEATVEGKEAAKGTALGKGAAFAKK